MEIYANKNGDSGVARYQVGDSHIIIEFKPNKYSKDTFYKYTYVSAGQVAVEEMRRLAEQGHGLHSYITTKVKKGYLSKGSSIDSL